MPPDFAIVDEKERDGIKWFSIDVNKATYQGRKWKDLNDFYKRKFENLLVLSHPKERIGVVYNTNL